MEINKILMEIWISERFSIDKKGFMRLDRSIMPDKETLKVLNAARSNIFKV